MWSKTNSFLAARSNLTKYLSCEVYFFELTLRAVVTFTRENVWNGRLTTMGALKKDFENIVWCAFVQCLNSVVLILQAF